MIKSANVKIYTCYPLNDIPDITERYEIVKATKHLADVLFFFLNPPPSPFRINITDITQSDQNSISVKKMQSKDGKEEITNFGIFFF